MNFGPVVFTQSCLDVNLMRMTLLSLCFPSTIQFASLSVKEGITSKPQSKSSDCLKGGVRLKEMGVARIFSQMRQRSLLPPVKCVHIARLMLRP